MTDHNDFLDEHRELTRRYFMRLGLASSAALGASLQIMAAEDDKPKPPAKPDKAGARPDPYFTAPEHFRDISRGRPLPHSLSEQQKREAGLTRETWKLEVISDPDQPARRASRSQKQMVQRLISSRC